MAINRCRCVQGRVGDEIFFFIYRSSVSLANAISLSLSLFCSRKPRDFFSIRGRNCKTRSLYPSRMRYVFLLCSALLRMKTLFNFLPSWSVLYTDNLLFADGTKESRRKKATDRYWLLFYLRWKFFFSYIY